MQSSPSGMPRPELAPSRQRSPTVMTIVVAARERAHDRGAAADVAAVADHDAGRDAPLDHRRAERAGVVVDEALVHDRGALGEVRAEPHAVGVGDAHAARHDVVDHARELVDAVHGELLAARVGRDARRARARPQPRPGARPGDVREQREDPGEVRAMRAGCAQREQVQAAGTTSPASTGASSSDGITVTISVRGTRPPAATAGSRLRIVSALMPWMVSSRRSAASAPSVAEPASTPAAARILAPDSGCSPTLTRGNQASSRRPSAACRARPTA